jgi:short-subunit dehydrogenase
MTVSKCVCLFGWGPLLEQCFDELVSRIGSKPDYILDNSESKWGKSFRGIPCVSPKILLDLDNPRVYITIRNYEGVLEQLANENFDLYVCIFERSQYKLKKLTPSDQFMINEGLVESLGKELFLDKRVMVTGASRGLGREIAKTFAKLGCDLILHASKIENLQNISAECMNLGANTQVLAADLADPKQIDDMLDLIGDQKIDILYNNAAYSPGIEGGPYGVSNLDFSHTYQVNAVAPVRLSNHFLPKMLQRCYGRIINISTSVQFKPEASAYAMSKAALDKYSIDMAEKLINTGVSMHLLDPGWMKTDMTGNLGPNSALSPMNGVILCVILGPRINGKWIMAQDFSSLTFEKSISKCNFLYDSE